MNWFYAQNGRQAGPVDDAEFNRLAVTGVIRADTLVWHSGLANWQPYSQVAAAPPASAPGGSAMTLAGTQAAAAGMVAAYAPASGQVQCSECRQSFPPDEIVRIEGLNVCARCKPVLLQKLREGVRPSGAGFLYAGFWIRFLASTVDFVLMFIVNMVINIVLTLALPRAFQSDGTNLLPLFSQSGISLVMNTAYQAILISRTGSTLGMMVCGLKVIRPDGSPLSLARGVARYFAKLLSAFTLGIGYVMVAFDDEKRGLHDQIVDTRVIRKEAAVG